MYVGGLKEEMVAEIPSTVACIMESITVNDLSTIKKGHMYIQETCNMVIRHTFQEVIGILREL